MMQLNGKQIVVGVSGGIAAYKSPDLVRRLRDAGAEVQVVTTAAAEAFITPLTLQAVSGRAVRSSLLDPAAEAGMGHIELARWADAVVIAPASADLMARLAHGLADDLLTTLCLATAAPLVLAPAMNQAMWDHAATRANAAQLEDRGVVLLGPAEGDQACGDVGPGRMLEPAELVEGLAAALGGGEMAGVRVLVSAGPTREAVDPMRFVSNRSSGRMGFALARAAALAGAEVTLVAGPVVLPTPPRVARVDVTSAAELREAVLARLADCDIFIGAAAVADYRPGAPALEKLKRREGGVSLELEPTADIIAEAAQRADAPFLVGFAAESHDLEANARDKLERKDLDMVVANPVDVPGVGAEAADNEMTVLWHGGRVVFERAPKLALATRLIALVAERYRALGPRRTRAGSAWTGSA